MPVADDVVWLDVLPSMNKFRPTLQKEASGAADVAGKDAGGKFTGAFSRNLKLGAVIGGALAAAAAGNFLKEATREASDLGESLNAVQVTFGDAAGGINKLGEAAAESVGLSQSQFNSLAVQFSAFATTIAGEGGDVAGTMKDLTTRGADFASVMNLDVNEAMGLFQSGLAGETEPLRKYGIDLSAAAVENYALANGIVAAGEEMTEAQKVQARYAFLMEQTSKVQGDFTNTSDSLANSQRILGARWDDIQAQVGQKVIPTLEKFSGWVLNTGLPAVMNLGGTLRDNLGPVFKDVGDFIMNSFLPTARDLGEVVLPKLGSAFQTVGGFVSSTISFFRDHEAAATALGVVVGGVAALVVAAWTTQAVSSAINSAKSVAAWFATATASTSSAAVQSRSTAQVIVGWVATAASATLNAVKIAAAWALSVAQTGVLMLMYASQSVASAATSTAAWVAAQARTVASLVATGAAHVAQGAVMMASMATTAARVVASWVLMSAQATANAIRMAAAFVLAMGPVGWVIATIVGLVVAVIANWDKVKRFTTEAWDAISRKVTEVASAIWTAVTRKFDELKTSVVNIFSSIRDTVGGVWDGLVEKVKGPIRIVLTFVNDKMIDPVNDLLGKFPGNLRIPKIRGFMTGGYTGDGRRDEAKGIVHAGEYVFTQEQVRRLGLPRIEAIASGAIPKRGELSADVGGPLDFVKDAWNATGGKAVTAVGNAASWAKDMVVKGARKVAEAVLNPLANAAKSMTPDNVIGNILDGAIDRLMSGVLGKSDEHDKAAAAAAADGAGNPGVGIPAGDGSLGSNWSSLFATLKRLVPQARLNSGVRNTRDAHGRGKAVDFGFGTGPGGPGSAGLALIKRVLHDKFGKNLYELIYNGVGNDRPNLKNSRPLAYSRATQLQHRNHVHAAVYDQGGLWEPGTAGFNFTGGVERVLTPPQDQYFRKFVDLTDRRERVGSDRPAVHLYTPDIPHAMRALKAQQQEEEALAPAW